MTPVKICIRTTRLRVFWSSGVQVICAPVFHYDLVWCLSYFSITTTRHCDKGNDQKRRYWSICLQKENPWYRCSRMAARAGNRELTDAGRRGSIPKWAQVWTLQVLFQWHTFSRKDTLPSQHPLRISIRMPKTTEASNTGVHLGTWHLSWASCLCTFTCCFFLSHNKEILFLSQDRSFVS